MILKKFVEVTSMLGGSVIQLAHGNTVRNMCFHLLGKYANDIDKKSGFSGNLICTGKHTLTMILRDNNTQKTYQ